MLPLVLLGIVGVAAAAVGLTQGPKLQHIAAGLGLPFNYVQVASKWGKRRGLPLDWVLATILVESGGNARAAGDADGRSAGLMQVNTVANAAEMRAAGVARAQMFDPETNIEWGTKYLRQFRDGVSAAAVHGLPAGFDELTRLAYKGPSAVYSVLRRGGNPLTELSWAPEAISHWRQAMARVRGAEARGRALAGRSASLVS